MKFLFFDLETTGFGFEKCAIIQIGAIVVEMSTDGKMKPLDAINLKMRPRTGKYVDQRALEVNGFKIDEILSWQDDREAYKKFTVFLSKYIDKYDKISKFHLVGYNNSHFDSDFLRQWFVENDDNFFGSWFWTDQIDVMCEASRYLIHYRPILNNFKLGNVASVLGIQLDPKSLHDGMYDIKITYKIFKKIIESGKLFLPFDEQKATDIFNEQTIEKSKSVKSESKFTEENAWILI